MTAKRLLLLLTLPIFLAALSVPSAVQADEGEGQTGWGDFFDANGNLLPGVMDMGVQSVEVDWMPQLPDWVPFDFSATFHMYATESGATVLVPTATTLFFMAMNPYESGLFNSEGQVALSLAWNIQGAGLTLGGNVDWTPANLLHDIGAALSITEPFQTSLALYRLSEDGKDLCRTWGWLPVESEWERIIRLHQGETQQTHTLMLLTFALHARLRGWNASVLPQVEGTNAVPDILVEKDGERWYVEVERGDGSRRKWKNLADLNGGRVALCTADENGRRELVGDCKGLKLGGVAADLRSLVFDENNQPRRLTTITPNDPLWLERW